MTKSLSKTLSCIGLASRLPDGAREFLFFLMTPQQRIDWINNVDEISHRLHELMAIRAKLKDDHLADLLDINWREIDDLLQATKDVLPDTTETHE
jgi:hypothetical protein